MVRLIILRIHHVAFTSLRCFSTKPKIMIDDFTSISLSNKEIKHKNHPGIIKPRTPTFPKWATEEIRSILKDHQINLKEISESAKKLICHLSARHPPLEHHELQKQLQKVEKRLNDNTDEKISIKDVNFHQNKKAKILIKQHIYNWQPIHFDKFTSLTYLVAKSVQNHAVLYRILNEIKARDKDFKLKTLFDFGSGIGTVMWAASEIWPNSLDECFCVETSESMIELSERFTKVAKPKIKNVFYRQYFPAAINPTYDIVVSAYSLFELSSMQARLETILKLWQKTERYFIVVEEGTNAGFKVVNEARDFILKYANSKNQRNLEYAHVFSPCPHDLACPRLAMDNTPCNFMVLHHPLKLLGGHEHKQEHYSYVVLKKSKRPENDQQWPRIVRDVLKRSKHVICRMCTANGEIKEEIFTEYKNEKHMYRCARSSKWGDSLPMHYKEQQESLGGRDETVDERADIE